MKTREITVIITPGRDSHVETCLRNISACPGQASNPALEKQRDFQSTTTVPQYQPVLPSTWLSHGAPMTKAEPTLLYVCPFGQDVVGAAI
jgi:hypothetical protein